MVVVVDGAKSFQCRDGLLLWTTVGQGPYVLVVGGRGWVGREPCVCFTERNN